MEDEPRITARIGHLYPSGGLCEDEAQRMAPPGIRFHTTRMPFRRTGIEDDLRLVDGLEGHASLLADADVDLIAFNCTAASMLIGSERIQERIRSATGLDSVTTIDAVRDGLRALAARRIILLNPYPAEVERHEIDYLAGLDIEVLASGGPECSTPVEQGNLRPTLWLEEARRLVRQAPTADTILISCAGTPVAGVLAEIEAITGLPVVASNQALIWKVLQTLGHPHDLPQYGRLMSALHSPPDPAREATPR